MRFHTTKKTHVVSNTGRTYIHGLWPYLRLNRAYGISLVDLTRCKMTVFTVTCAIGHWTIIHLYLDRAHCISAVDLTRCKMTVLHSYMCHRTQDNHTFMFSQSTRYFILGFNPIQDDTFSQVHVTTYPGLLYMYAAV